MSDTYTKLLFHLVWCTKHRRPFIAKPWRSALHAKLATIGRDRGAHVVRVGGVEDHVHVLLDCPPCLRLADLVRDMKKLSTRWVKAEHPQMAAFGWQSGYSAFSVSPSHRKRVDRYIANQEQHHRRRQTSAPRSQ